MPADVYRAAASVLVLRPAPEGKGYQLLLLHKPRRRDAWQLPQGGVEKDESIEDAALRELHEEAGLHDVEVVGASREVYQYDFPASFRTFRPDNVCGQRICYVFALAPADATVTVDGKEIDRFLWVEMDALGHYVKRQEYASLIQRLAKEALVHLRGRS